MSTDDGRLDDTLMPARPTARCAADVHTSARLSHSRTNMQTPTCLSCSPINMHSHCPHTHTHTHVLADKPGPSSDVITHTQRSKETHTRASRQLRTVVA